MVKPFASSSDAASYKLILLVAALAACSHSFAQKYFSGRYEIGTAVGVSNYHGDLSHGPNFKNFHPSFSLLYKYNLSSYFSWRLGLSYLKVSGSDEGVKGYDQRNLTFQTDIWDFGSTFEFNFQAFGTNVNDKTWTPYVFSGIHGFLFDPTRQENKDIKLRNLRTEGQKRAYSRFQPAVPLGFGIKTMLRPQKNRGVWIIGFEGCWRKTFTDRLDDVSGKYPDYRTMVDNQGIGAAQYSHAQTLNGGNPMPAGTMRGDPHLKDWYYFVGFTASYRFTPLICR